MVSHVKTTIDIAQPLLERAKKLAVERRTTLRSIVEDALREHLETRSQPPKRFRLKFRGVSGKGLQPGIQEGDWETITALAYEGRGG
jgi:hypothetical protein